MPFLLLASEEILVMLDDKDRCCMALNKTDVRINVVLWRKKHMDNQKEKLCVGRYGDQ